MRVSRFGDIPITPTPTRLRRLTPGRAVVSVTHASVGVTDLAAVEGEYLLQPFPRFAAGYDVVGVIEHLGERSHPELLVGQHVAGILPRMGAHTTHVSVPASLLVPVPAGLDPLIAASVPLDGATAWFALDALGDGKGPLLVQGAGGAVGAWATQFAVARGCRVFGTASPRTQHRAEALGARVLDYRDPHWVGSLLHATNGGVAGAIDHTGSPALRRAVRADGRVVRIAFDGGTRHPRRATAAGFISASLRRYARPSERVCSIPMIVTTRRRAYRGALSTLLDDLVRGSLLPPQVHEYRFNDYASALTAAKHVEPGSKIVLSMPQ